MEANHSKCCKASDKPVAGLLADLKARGMLKDTLVVWGGEFGRTPFAEVIQDRVQTSTGAITIRGDSPCGWPAAGQPGQPDPRQHRRDRPARGGRSDHVQDIHASILWMLGLNHLQLTFMHNGSRRAADRSGGEVVKSVFA